MKRRSWCPPVIGTFAVSALLACSATPGDDAERTAEGAGCSAPAYVAGKTYAAGDVVTAGGKTYQCKPYPYSGWCGMGAAYAPGSGFAWSDAWNEIGSCSGSGSSGSGSSGSSGSGSSGGSCSAGAWSAGTSYHTGDIVSYGGKLYVATHDNPGYDPTISTWFWSPTSCSGSSSGGSSGGASSGGSTSASGFAGIVSRSTFEAMFPSRNGFYTYDGLVEATKTYPAFATSGSSDAQKREVAAFLANVAHETGYLVYVEEIDKADYTDWGSSGCAPAAGKRYFGRGPLQLSWNYNYCAASQSIFGDPNVLRLDPDRVANDARVSWATGLWFWMTSTGAGSMTSHDAITKGAGFGQTVQTINGSIECGGRNPAAVQSRIDAYKKFCSMLGVDPGSGISC